MRLGWGGYKGAGLKDGGVGSPFPCLAKGTRRCTLKIYD